MKPVFYLCYSNDYNGIMKKENAIRVFEHKQVRTHWDEAQEKWYFSVVDVISILTEQDAHQGPENIGVY